MKQELLGISVILGSTLFWSAILLLMVGISFGRMGPSFSRSNFSLPIILLGILLLIFNNSPIENPELDLLDSIHGFAPWFFVCSLGCFLVLRGSPIYWKVRYLFISVPLIIIAALFPCSSISFSLQIRNEPSYNPITGVSLKL